MNLDAIIQQSGNFDQVTNDQINVLCDTASGALTINLPRCPTTPANLKILVLDAQGNAAVNNILIAAAAAVPSVYSQDGINGGATMVINTDNSFLNIQMAIQNVQEYNPIAPLPFGAWIATAP